MFLNWHSFHPCGAFSPVLASCFGFPAQNVRLSTEPSRKTLLLTVWKRAETFKKLFAVDWTNLPPVILIME